MQTWMNDNCTDDVIACKWTMRWQDSDLLESINWDTLMLPVTLDTIKTVTKLGTTICFYVFTHFIELYTLYFQDAYWESKNE